jgi:hypothetical protein
MIVFFRTSRLINELREDSVPEFHKFLYLFLPLLLLYLGGRSDIGLYDLLGKNRLSTLEIADFIFDITLFIGGSLLLWKINQNGDNKNFVERYICLNFPAIIIVNITGFLLGFLGPLFLSAILKYEGQELTNYYMYVKTIGLNLNYILYFVLMANWMKKTAQY